MPRTQLWPFASQQQADCTGATAQRIAILPPQPRPTIRCKMLWRDNENLWPFASNSKLIALVQLLKRIVILQASADYSHHYRHQPITNGRIGERLPCNATRAANLPNLAGAGTLALRKSASDQNSLETADLAEAVAAMATCSGGLWSVARSTPGRTATVREILPSITRFTAAPPSSSNKRFRSWLASRSRSNLTRYAGVFYILKISLGSNV